MENIIKTTKMNKEIKIYRRDVENMRREIAKMKEELKERYYRGVVCQEKYMRTGTNARTLRIELNRLEQLYDKTEDLLADASFNFICVDAAEWFKTWQFEETVEDMFINKYYMFPADHKGMCSCDSKNNIEKEITKENSLMKKFAKTIKIYRSDVENMKSKIRRRMQDMWSAYWEESQWEDYGYLGTSANEVWVELGRTSFLCDKADALLSDESFDFIYVDADEWFNEWNIEDCIVEGLIDEYYMLPDSDEVDEIFEKMKANYKYTVEDLFGFYRFYPIDENTVVA